MKEFKDCHLYLGCEVMTDIGKCKLLTVMGNTAYCQLLTKENAELLSKFRDISRNVYEAIEKGEVVYEKIGIKSWHVKLILRPLGDMTEGELIEMQNIIMPYEEDFEITEDMRKKAFALIKKDGMGAMRFDESNKPLMVFEMVRFLLSKHFDLFGLHEAGLCLYKTDLK